MICESQDFIEVQSMKLASNQYNHDLSTDYKSIPFFISFTSFVIKLVLRITKFGIKW